jgi:hypothetical protein
LISEVIADIDAESAEIVLVIHWMGGVHTELRLPLKRKGQRNKHRTRYRRRRTPARADCH